MSNKKPALFIGFLVVVAIIVILVVQKTLDKSQTPNSLPEADQPSADNATNSTTTVTAPIVAQDGSYTVMQATNSEVIGEITTYSFGDSNSLNVMPAAMQSVVLNETPTLNEASVMVAGLPGKKLTLSSAKDGSPFFVVQVISNDQLFDFRGNELFLDTLNQYIVFNQVR